jgi:hypothetical protein
MGLVCPRCEGPAGPHGCDCDPVKNAQEIKDLKTENESLHEAIDYMIEKLKAIHSEAEFLTPGNVAHRKTSLRSICLNAVNRVNKKWLKKENCW